MCNKVKSIQRVIVNVSVNPEKGPPHIVSQKARCVCDVAEMWGAHPESVS